MRRKIIISIIILVVLGSILGFTLLSREKNNAVRYEKVALEKGDIEALVSTTGVINPVTIVEVGSQVSGRISRIYVDFNSRVKNGEVLAEIDPSQILTRIKQSEANYESARADLEKSRVTFEIAEKQYHRAATLFESAMISFEEKESAEAQYLTSKADLKSAEARLQQSRSQLESSNVDLGYTIIKSPIDGIVISRNINVGQTVAASFQAPVLFQIANDLSKMQVECSIDEADIGKIKEGQKARFTVDAFPDDNFNGKVIQVRYSPEVVQNVVTYTTIVDVDNTELKLRPGMTATASIITGEAKDVLLIPNSALRFTPSFSPEKMREIMMKMRAEMSQGDDQTRRERRDTDPGTRTQGQGERMFSMDRGTGPSAGQRRQFSRIWIEDEKGELKPIAFKAGVSDDNHTEVVHGKLTEGQFVITGVATGSQVGDRPRSDLMRGGRFMFGR